jgi:hypothetical protein
VLLEVRFDDAARARTITSTRNAIAAIAMSIQVFESCGTSTPVVVVVEVECDFSTVLPDEDPPDDGAVETDPLPEDEAPPWSCANVVVAVAKNRRNAVSIENRDNTVFISSTISE